MTERIGARKLVIRAVTLEREGDLVVVKAWTPTGSVEFDVTHSFRKIVRSDRPEEYADVVPARDF